MPFPVVLAGGSLPLFQAMPDAAWPGALEAQVGIRVSLLFSRSLANDKNTVGLIVRTSFISPDHHYPA
jgi:hypothetical protein